MYWHRAHVGRPWGASRVSWFGILLVLLGTWWLLGELGVVRFRWEYAGPLALIFLGLTSILRRAWWGWAARRDWREAGGSTPLEPKGRV